MAVERGRVQVRGAAPHRERARWSNSARHGIGVQRRRTTPYLILHEEVEKTLIEQLNLHYLHAHQIATRAEQAAVRAAGVRWRDYDRFMQKYVKRIGDERLTKVPADLDLKPYRDEHDYDLVRRMLASIAHGQGPQA
jgi:hypothetical protein